MAFGENKPQVITRVANDVKERSYQAFLTAMSQTYTEGSTPQEHIIKMATVFSNQMAGIVGTIYVNMDDYNEAPEPNNIFGV